MNAYTICISWKGVLYPLHFASRGAPAIFLYPMDWDEPFELEEQ